MVNLTATTIAAAQAAQRKYYVPASVTLAQYGLESTYGQHMPVGSNNPFGIKAVGDQPSVLATTHEVIGGRTVTVKAKFRKFDSIEEAFDAHGALLGNNPLYKPAIEAWLSGSLGLGVMLMAKHYASDPHYADELLQIIKSEGFTKYDTLPAAPHPAPVPQPAPAAPAPSARVPTTPQAPTPKPATSTAKPFWLELLEGLLSIFKVVPRGK